jgi:hypothetical protein
MILEVLGLCSRRKWLKKINKPHYIEDRKSGTSVNRYRTVQIILFSAPAIMTKASSEINNTVIPVT